MRILHTSDWHLGKKLENISRLDEQRAVLDEIVEICENLSVQLVLVAGDIFDSFVPPSDAEELFFEALSKLSGNKRIVLIVSGNHDDSVRLNASRYLSTNANVYFSDCDIVKFNPKTLDSNIRMVEACNNYFVVSDGVDDVFCGMLSYPTEIRLKEKIDDSESYSDKVKRWIEKCFENNKEGISEIFVSHLFMLGGVKSDSERSIELGGARIVDKSVLSTSILYSALGHLHKYQVVDKTRNIIYCGSILGYSFDETQTEKSVNVFDVENHEVRNLKRIKLTKGKRLYRICAESLSEAYSKMEGIDGFCEVTLSLDKPLDRLEHREFMKRFPNAFLRLKFNSKQTFSTDKRELEDKELFVQFYKEKLSTEPDEEIVKEFLRVINSLEVDDETC